MYIQLEESKSEPNPCAIDRTCLTGSLLSPQGYTIPLDKRLAADGRGLQDHTINDNFAKLAQSLYTADREVSRVGVVG